MQEGAGGGEGCTNPAGMHKDVLTSFSKGTGTDDKVGAGATDEAHDIVGGLQVMPEAHILMVEDIIRPMHPSEHLHTDISPICRNCDQIKEEG